MRIPSFGALHSTIAMRRERAHGFVQAWEDLSTDLFEHLACSTAAILEVEDDVIDTRVGKFVQKVD